MRNVNFVNYLDNRNIHYQLNQKIKRDVGIDLIELSVSEYWITYVLTAIDVFGRFGIVTILNNKTKIEVTGKLFKLFREYIPPYKILCDNDLESIKVLPYRPGILKWFLFSFEDGFLLYPYSMSIMLSISFSSLILIFNFV